MKSNVKSFNFVPNLKTLLRLEAVFVEILAFETKSGLWQNGL